MGTKTVNFDKVRNWLAEMDNEKSAAVKSAAKPLSEHGERKATSHPIADIDDGLCKVKPGTHAAANSADVKASVVGNVDETPDNAGPSQQDQNMNIGVRQSLTGEDPATENNFKDRPKDPGTSSEWNADHLGEKYSEWALAKAGSVSARANKLLASWTVDAGAATAPVTSATATQDKAASATATQTQNTAVEAGYELAGLLGMDKRAADEVADHVVSGVIAEAVMAAHRVGTHMHQFIAKVAAEEAEAEGEEGGEEGPPKKSAPPAPEGEGPDAAAAGGMPPGADEAGAAMAAGAGAPPMGGDAGGMPPGPGGPGGPGGDAGGGMGMDQHKMQAMQEILMAMQELGIDPQELAAMAQQTGDPGAAEAGAKMASAAQAFRRSGRFEIRPAKSASERVRVNEMKKLMIELMQNNNQS